MNPSKRKLTPQEIRQKLEEAEIIGERRQTVWYNQLVNLFKKNSNFSVFNNQGSHAGPDILVKFEGRDYLCFEITNYKQSSSMTNKRFLRYIANLSKYNCDRQLVLSFPENLRYANYSYNKNLIQPKSELERIKLAENLLKKHHIHVFYVGHQD
jgi:hypothetical protein